MPDRQVNTDSCHSRKFGKQQLPTHRRHSHDNSAGAPADSAAAVQRGQVASSDPYRGIDRDSGSGSKGALAGGVIGGVRGRATSRQQAVVQEQVSATDPAKNAEYNKAREACLAGKGYTVK